MPKPNITSRANGNKTPHKLPRKRRAKRAADSDPAQPSQRQLRARTAEDITNEQTAEQLALRIWAALVGEKTLSTMSGLVDELLDAHLLDDDDEEADESWLDEHYKRENKLLDEAIADGLDKYSDIAAINNLTINLSHHSDPDMADAAKQLREVLAKCAIGATQFDKRFPRPQLERMVKRDVKKRLEKDAKYSKHVREDVPGSHIRKYGERGRTSSKGTFVRAVDYEHGGGLASLLTGGWIRVAKDRIDPDAWSYQFGFARKSELQHWRHHFIITERSGKQSPFELKRETLHGTGSTAIKALLRSGVHVIRRKTAAKALAQFLGFGPKKEIVRMPRVGWAQVGARWVFVRPDEVLMPAGMQATTNYRLDTTANRHGLHIAGTAAAWAAEIAAPLIGNSNVALSFGTFFAAPLLGFASEPGGGFHEHGPSTIGKTMASDVGQSIYGWPHETADDAFGVSWAGSEAGFDALALARTDLGLPLDEITLADQRKAEQVIYKLASGTKGPRATSAGHLRETAHATVLVLSTGEKSLTQFIGKGLQEGARKRLVDVPAEVQSGSAFETIPRQDIHIVGGRLFDAMKRQHGAVGREWQRHLVELGPDTIKVDLNRYRKDFLGLPEVLAVAEKAHPQVRAVVNRFALLAAALRMAIVAGLLPWTPEQANAGIVACMERWVSQRGNVDTAGEVVRAAHQIALALAANLDQFIHIRKAGKAWAAAAPADEVKQRTSDRFDGYVKPDPKHGDLILIRPEAWRRYCNGFDCTAMAQHFKQRDILIARGKGTTQSEQVIGRSERFYVLRRSSLTSLTG